ncbi:hypothetical protein H072_9394 [Dactylellina haptotyla CBS 200.50]|uniref:Uncharacterized protein n=1 Tax=Dactylellina haptotyla (strain CBS 200.50) TaxID=1284197 RepID=S8BCU8_DACHA|nr:hypothetical protein H072_9394 [Dactylellina haptotyla CBS 200.50]
MKLITLFGYFTLLVASTVLAAPFPNPEAEAAPAPKKGVTYKGNHHEKTADEKAQDAANQQRAHDQERAKIKDEDVYGSDAYWKALHERMRNQNHR